VAEYGADFLVSSSATTKVSIMISLDRQQPGDLRTTIARIDALRHDLLAIDSGHQPAGLANSPTLDFVVLGKRVVPCLYGHVGQAANHSAVIKTPEILLADWDAGWVRTRDGFFRLNRALDLKTR
jgi:hypothetical protein